GLDSNKEQFYNMCDFNRDNVIDHNDYIILMNNYGIEKKDPKFNQIYDLYPADLKTFSLSNSGNQQPHNKEQNKTLNFLVSGIENDMVDSTDLTMDNEPFFVKSSLYLQVKSVIEKIKFPLSNIKYFDKDNLIVISDIRYHLKKYKKLIEYIYQNTNYEVQEIHEFVKIYKIPDNKEKYLKTGKWIIYDKNSELLYSNEFLQEKSNGKIFKYESIKLKDFVASMNKEMQTSYSVSELISDDTITVLSKYQVPFKFFPEIFVSILNLNDYKIIKNKIENAGGLNFKSKRNAIIIFEYEHELTNFDTSVKIIQDEGLKFRILPEFNICIAFADIKVLKELTEKWEQITEILKKTNIKMYKIHILNVLLAHSKLTQVLNQDRASDIEILKSVDNIDEDIKLCPLTYNNSILAALPKFMERYISDILSILDADEQQSPELKNEFVYVHNLVYNSSKEVSEFLNKLYSNTASSSSSDNINIVSSENSNSVIIRTKNKKRLNEMKAALFELDKKPEQVLIKVLIAEVKLDDSERYGFEWQLGDKYQSAGVEQNLRQADLALNSPLTGLRYSLLNTNKYNLFFNLAAEQSSVNILSKPQILTKNNTPAKIIIGKEVPIVKIQGSSSDDNNNTDKSNNSLSLPATTQSIVLNHNLTNYPDVATEYKDVGITLEVTPNISSDSSIMLNIKQTVSEIETLSMLNNPVIKKREASTIVIVKNNYTVALGGMIKKDQVTSIKKVPILSKIPYLGKALFTSEEKNDVNTELLIFITPVISNDNLNETPVEDLPVKNIKIKNN
nr:type II secretion system protein GspD [Candidatus Dependentiae bacterium]